ncbi:hypothetical protein POSPLADRAFT_1048541 [Postia placenta MAD-698-R-SB12]|uniref:Uncharacterized protein n=1 Tax=Postia placenta MAD-698-R-SB12 TaxID=670580 RepID=A0A1X6MS37_9APHY|nr:hypothetical protein POSPLADRAFT_1048541 [Postia placenta MAD-698-R-SB12]OSX59195.1 hypothetical protein POSPLADRAFT_1048541 [Postia placenta MAD-698-R-SB12]
MPEAQSRRNVLSLRSATFGSCRRVGTHKLLCSASAPSSLLIACSGSMPGAVATADCLYHDNSTRDTPWYDDMRPELAR